jgi:hypothetical protein
VSRVVITVACTLPASGATPAVLLPKGAVAEVTLAMASAISSAGGSTRAVSSAYAHDQLGEAFGVANSE